MTDSPFRLLQCCLVTDGGGALILTSADRAKDFPRKPVYIMGTGESVETPMVSQMQTFDSSRAFRTAGPLAFKEAGIAVATGAPWSSSSTAPPGNTSRFGMNLCPAPRIPINTCVSAAGRSTNRLAAGRGMAGLSFMSRPFIAFGRRG